MNKLIPGALFSARAAQQQRRQAREMGDNPYPGDVRDTFGSWSRAAQGFRKHDPDGRKLAVLFSERPEEGTWRQLLENLSQFGEELGCLRRVRKTKRFQLISPRSRKTEREDRE